MNNLKTILFYLAGAIGLIIATTLFRVDSNSELARDFMMTSTPGPTAPPPTRVRIEAGPLGCVTTPWGGRDGYLPDAPYTDTLAPPDAVGQLLLVSGTVYTADCVTPLPGVEFAVWHADAEGAYDPRYFRARLVTDAAGHYEFRTVMPRPYIAYNQYIPARIHYLLTYPSGATVATQIYFEGDPFLVRQIMSSNQQRLIRSVVAESGPDGSVMHTTFDLVMAVDAPVK